MIEVRKKSFHLERQSLNFTVYVLHQCVPASWTFICLFVMYHVTINCALLMDRWSSSKAENIHLLHWRFTEQTQKSGQTKTANGSSYWPLTIIENILVMNVLLQGIHLLFTIPLLSLYIPPHIFRLEVRCAWWAVLLGESCNKENETENHLLSLVKITTP